MSKRTFYDQWYRIGDLRVGLRGSVLVRQHHFRSEPWFVYYDPAHNGYYRARPDTHEVIKHISPTRTLRSIWRDFVETHPEAAPGQEEFFELITELYRGNMLYIEGSVDEARILDRAIAKKRKPLAQNISQVLFFRMPLWDPEPLLERHKALIDRFYSWPIVSFIAVVCLLAVYVFVLNIDRAMAQSANILQSNNLVALFIATFATHFLHEMSHAALCKHFGGHVRTMGVMFLMFTPLPYADVTASWSFRDPYKRAMVGAAGMYIDLFICALSVLFWAYSPPGLANEMAVNLMFVTAFYTFVFNANPLMRFDGHYILSDLVAIPNLHKVAQSQFNAVFKHYALADPYPIKERVSPKRRSFLVVFFLTSFVYRNIVMIGIVVFVADQYYGLGLVGALAIAYSSFVLPLSKTLKPLGNKNFMAKYRKRINILLTLAALVVAVLVFVPVPDSRRLEGVIEAMDRTAVHAPVEGEVVSLPRRAGQALEMGDIILELRNPDLADRGAEINAALKSNQARELQASAAGGYAHAAIHQERAALSEQIQDNAQQIAQLTTIASHNGVWIPDKRGHKPGNWVARGEPIGQLVNENRLKFLGILHQEASYGIATLTEDDVSIRIEGQRGQVIPVQRLIIVPYSQKDLPSAALTPLGGGGAAISTQDSQSLQSVERFFLFTAVLDTSVITQMGLDGRTGWLRMSLPARPLAAQGWERVQQFFQKRYKL